MPEEPVEALVVDTEMPVDALPVVAEEVFAQRGLAPPTPVRVE